MKYKNKILATVVPLMEKNVTICFSASKFLSDYSHKNKTQVSILFAVTCTTLRLHNDQG